MKKAENISKTEAAFARKITLPLIVFYGLGTILGAGIYVLVGHVAEDAGSQTPGAFLLAAVIAFFTANTYAKLSRNFPKSAGEAVYIQAGFQNIGLSQAVGFLVILTGIVSSATLANGFAGYASVFLSWSEFLLIVAPITVLGLVAIWGIGQSVWLAALMTMIEIFGLLVVIYFNGSVLSFENLAPGHFLPDDFLAMGGMLGGALIAFYAFIGFEDMVNVAEEVRRPEKNLPRAIFITLLIAAIFYLIIALIAILSLPPDVLVASKAPLSELLRSKSADAAAIVAIISLVAIVNGILVQMIMASRVLHAISRDIDILGIFTRINPRTKTPINATFVMIVLVLAFALWLPIKQLAALTSIIILVIFTMLNIALIRLSIKYGKVRFGGVLMPIFGAALCALLLGAQIFG